MVKQARLFQNNRKLFGWDDNAVHFDVQLYDSSSDPPSGNVVLFSEDGLGALRYSTGTTVFVGLNNVVVSELAKTATSQSYVTQDQLVMAALGKPDHPHQQWQRFAYLISGHLHAPEAMLACHARSEETTDLSLLAFEVARQGLLPKIYASTAGNWLGGDLVEFKSPLALPSVLDGPVFALLGGQEPTLMIARVLEEMDDQPGVCFFIGEGTVPALRQAAYEALQKANPGKFSTACSDVKTVSMFKDARGPAIPGLFAAVLAANPTWCTKGDVEFICTDMDTKVNVAALTSIVRVLEPCSTRKDRSSLGQRVRETELENATLKNELKLQAQVKDNEIAALKKRIMSLTKESVAAKTTSVMLQAKLEAARPAPRMNVMRIADVSKDELVQMKPPASWASGDFQERTICPPHSYPGKLLHRTAKDDLQHPAQIRVRVYEGGPVFNIRDAYLCTLSRENNFGGYTAQNHMLHTCLYFFLYTRVCTIIHACLVSNTHILECLVSNTHVSGL